MENEALINKSENSDQFRYQFLKTAFLVLFWVAYGDLSCTIGTTMVDFEMKLHTTFDKLGVALTIFSIALVVGAIAASVLRDKARVTFELILTVTGIMMASACFLIPRSQSLVFFGGMIVAAGFSMGCLNTASVAMVVAIWREKAPVPLHALHFAFGLGAFLGPFLTKDFVSVRCPSHNNTMVFENSTILKICINSTDENPTIITPSRLEIPFSLIAALAVLVSCVFFIYYLIEKCFVRFRQTPAAIWNQENETIQVDDEQQSLKSVLPFVMGLFFFCFFLISFEGVLSAYIFPFAFKSGLGFDEQEAAYLQSAYWGSYVASRFAASVMAHFVSVKVMLFVEMTGSIGSLLGLLFLGFNAKTAMWAFFCSLAFFVAPIWPSSIAWADRYVPVKAYVMATADVGSGIGAALSYFSAGHFLEIGMSRSYLYVAVSASVAASLLLIVMQLLGHKRGDRHQKKSSS